MRPILLCAVAACLAAAPLGAQEVQTALVPDTASVGDVVRVIIQVTGLAGGARLDLPDTLAISGNVENAARLRTRQDSVDGSGRVTAVYSVTPWRPGTTALPTVSGRVVDPGGATRPLSVVLPAVPVRSVLPVDTAGVKPKPPRDVLGASRLWWPPVVALAQLLGLLAAVLWWWRRRRGRAVPELLPERSPRERALEALDRAHALGLVERGEVKTFYSLVTEAVREYLAAVEPRWGVDLTTREVLARMTRAAWSVGVPELSELLHAADLVKFARRRPAADETEAEWTRARTWVIRYPPAPALPRPEQAA